MKVLRTLLIIFGSLILLLAAAIGVTLALVDLDGLIARYQPKAVAAASEAVGRPIELGRVSARWFPTVAVVAEDLVVDSSTLTADEPPLLEVRQLRLSLALWPAIRSLGKDLQLAEIAVVEPVVRVRRRPDGTWSFSDLLESKTPAEPAPEEQMTDEERRGFIDYLERAEIGRVAIEDGQVLYEDPDRSLTVRDLDFEILDLALGRPVEAELELALAAEEQNVGLSVRTERLPDNLLGFVPPAVERGTLRIEGLPLDGFLPKIEGYDLDRAALDANLQIDLSEGGIDVGGPIEVKPLRWVEGGRTGPDFAVGTTLDVLYDLDPQRMKLDGTVLNAGPLAFELSSTVDVAGPTGPFRLETRRGVTLAELAPLAPGLDALPGAALTLAADGQLSTDAVTVKNLLVGLGPAELRARARYPLGPSGRLTASFDTGTIDLPSLVTAMDIEGLALPDRSELVVRGSYGAPVERAAEGTLTIERFRFSAGKSELDASGEVTSFSPVAARLEGESPYLNLDELMPPPSEEPAEPEKEPAAEEPSALEGVDVVVDLAIDRVVYAGVTANGAKARLRLKDERAVLERLTFEVFGGRVAASGTRVDLGRDPIAYDLVAKLESLSASELLGFLSPALQNTLSGQLSTDLDLSGAGLDVAAISKSLNGSLSMALAGGELSGVDLVRSAAEPLVEALEVVRLEPSKRLATDFRRLAGTFTVEDGKLVSRKPIEIDTPSGPIRLDGNIGLDQSIALSGDVTLSPDFIRSVSGGKLRPRSAIPVGLNLGCSLTKPCVRGIDAEAAVSSLLRSAVGGAVGKARDEVKEEVKEKAEAIEEKAEEKAEEAKEKAEEKVEEVKDKAEKKAEEKVKKGLKSIFGN